MERNFPFCVFVRVCVCACVFVLVFVCVWVFVFVCVCDISRRVGKLLAGVQESRRF